VEWVHITAKTIDEARERALDTLGVDEQDVEIVVLEEPRAGLFGRRKGQAEIRARIRPTQVRPKVERRDRRSRKGDQKGKGSRNSAGRGAGTATTTATDAGSREPVTEAPDTTDPAAAAAAAAERRARGRRPERVAGVGDEGPVLTGPRIETTPVPTGERKGRPCLT
jgi:spoIIIJ-associated protein